MIRIIALVLLTLESIQGFGVTSVDDTTTTTPPTTTTTTASLILPDGSAKYVAECFLGVRGSCAACCGACTETTDLDNKAKDSCVCYEDYTKLVIPFHGSNYNDCVFIEADSVDGVAVRNQCLEPCARTKCSPRRGEEVDTRPGRVESVRP